jgi:hypothetical protein
VKQLAESHLSDLDERIQALTTMRDALVRLSESCCGDDRPDCPILEGLPDTGLLALSRGVAVYVASEMETHRRWEVKPSIALEALNRDRLTDCRRTQEALVELVTRLSRALPLKPDDALC